MRSHSLIVRFAVAVLLQTCLVKTAQSQVSMPQLAATGDSSEIVYSESTPADSKTSSAYPAGDYYEQLSAANRINVGNSCDSGCSDDWGCGGSPFRNGPGCDDRWKVGPRWRVQADGMILFREETDLTGLATAMGTTLAGAEQYENFDHAGGGRLFLSSYWPDCKDYELVVGYEGVDDWNANIILPINSIAATAGPPASVALDERRTLNYSSSLHSAELNFQSSKNNIWKPYAGIRYFSLDEVMRDETHQYTTAPLGIGDASATTDSLTLYDVQNNLIGFQLGARRDLWQISEKVYFQGYVNGGMYCNMINRAETTSTTDTTNEVLDDDPATTDVDETGTVETHSFSTGNRVKTERTELSFAGEANLALVWKINHCFALKSGYQAMVVTGVELADDAYLGLEDTHDLFYHGAFAGFEYRR